MRRWQRRGWPGGGAGGAGTRRPGLAALLLVAAAALAACGGMDAADRWPGRDDTWRPDWMPEPRERYPGVRLPDDGFLADLALRAPIAASRDPRREATLRRNTARG
jgi:hypothetical protein